METYQIPFCRPSIIVNSDLLFVDLDDLAKAPCVYGVLGIDVAALIIVMYVRILLKVLEFFVKRKIFNFDNFLNFHLLISWNCGIDGL